MWHTVCAELSWSHYRLLIRIKEQEKRQYYQKECIDCAWSVRQLERQINSFYYERILATSEGKRAEVQGEIQVLEPNIEPMHLIKYPYILEFLGLEENKAYLEHELEQGLIDNLQKFLLELGKGFCFVARQKRITIGIVLCSEKNETMVKYSILNEDDHLYASKYKLYIPSEEELKKEIERERFNIEQRLEDKEE